MNWLLSPLMVLALAPQDSTIAEDARPDTLGWPRVQTLEDRELVIYQPQLEKFHGNIATARTAVRVVEGEREMWCSMVHSARLATDRSRRLVLAHGGTLDEILFPPDSEATAEQRTLIEGDLRPLVEAWEPVFHMDDVMVALEFAETDPLDELDAAPDPLNIEFRTSPVIVVHVRGEPRYRQIFGMTLQQVINTAATLAHDPSAGTYHLWQGGRWWNANSLKGPWQAGSEKPGPYERITGHAPAAATPVPADTEILVSMQPTAVIQMHGPTQFQPIAGTPLSFLQNCESDVFRLDGSPTRFYALMSGRWYVADLPPGPWEPIASDQLPEDFQKIPPESAKGYVLANLAGTREAQDALLDALIPQTAVVRRNALNLTVKYDGDPEFVAVEGLGIDAARNTEFAVLRHADRYYSCFQGVWFEAAGPEGPWALALKIPDPIYQIPSSHPLYHVTYARIYQVFDEELEIGYTPGYLGSYAYQGTMVYGTGHDSGWANFDGWGASGYTYRYDPMMGQWIKASEHRAHLDAFGQMSATFAAAPPADRGSDVGGRNTGARENANELIDQLIDGKKVDHPTSTSAADQATGRTARIRRMQGAVTTEMQAALRQRLAKGYKPPQVPRNMRYQDDAFALPDGKVMVVEDNVWDGNMGPDAQFWDPVGLAVGYRRYRHHRRHH